MTTEPSNPSSSGTDNTTTPSSSTTDGLQTDIVIADFAACAFYEETSPDVMFCASLAEGTSSISVDLAAGGTMSPTAGYFVFTLPQTYALGSVVEFRVQFHTVEIINGGAMNQSGEVWAVEAFAADSLETAVPAQSGASPLADDMGVAPANSPIIFELPPDAVEGKTSLYLGLFPTTADGADFWDHEGDVPPQLEIVYAP